MQIEEIFIITEHIQRLSLSQWDTRDNSFSPPREDNTYNNIPDWATALVATWGFRSASKRAGETVTTGPENKGPFKVSNCPCGVITMLAAVCGVLEGEVFSVRKIRNKLGIKGLQLCWYNLGVWAISLKPHSWLKRQEVNFKLVREPQLGIYFLNHLSLPNGLPVHWFS